MSSTSAAAPAAPPMATAATGGSTTTAGHASTSLFAVGGRATYYDKQSGQNVVVSIKEVVLGTDPPEYVISIPGFTTDSSTERFTTLDRLSPIAAA